MIEFNMLSTELIIICAFMSISATCFWVVVANRLVNWIKELRGENGVMFLRLEVEFGWVLWSVLSFRERLILLAKTGLAGTILLPLWLYITYEHYRWEKWLISSERAKKELLSER